MKVALITGASSGIGEEFARRLAADGHNLVLVARSEKALHELCDELMLKHKIMAHYVALDLIEPDSDATLFEETQKHGFEVDWLINNAGFGSVGDFAQLPLDRELDMIDLNVRALIGLTHRYLPAMRDRKAGTIINVSSAAGFQPIPFMATYAATKAFVTSFSEAIAEENRPFGIEVLALCPGSTKTNFFAASNIDRPIQVKGQQTAEQVVDTALRAVKAGRSRVVSGFTNWVGSVLGTLVPSSISTRLMAKALRPRVQKDV
ncbi:MAG TPA: SDR family oxidoreductase [Pyrinomonadaceae bacterium]|jgi:short-subunit dehydrogenase|nr:SDR family oxidoreductase [Pyrinomonadaceae bacterium]